MVKASGACRRLTQEQSIIPLASAYLGLVPRRHQSGVLDYGGSISSCGDRRVCTLLYEAANVMLTRHKQLLKLTDWAIAAFFGASRPLPCVPAKDRTNGEHSAVAARMPLIGLSGNVNKLSHIRIRVGPRTRVGSEHDDGDLSDGRIDRRAGGTLMAAAIAQRFAIHLYGELSAASLKSTLLFSTTHVLSSGYPETMAPTAPVCSRRRRGA
jgi:transposase IS116/IS110/IS902 family protein